MLSEILKALLDLISKGASYFLTFLAGYNKAKQEIKDSVRDREIEELKYKNNVKDKLDSVTEQELDAYLEGMIESPKLPPDKR